MRLDPNVDLDNYNQTAGCSIKAKGIKRRSSRLMIRGAAAATSRDGGGRERVALCVVSARSDRGWTEHLHHLIYDPLRRDRPGRWLSATYTHTRATQCAVVQMHARIRIYTHTHVNTIVKLSCSLMHRQNKFAYACDRVRMELRDGKRETGRFQWKLWARTEWNTSVHLFRIERNQPGWSLRSDSGTEKVTRLL